MAITYDLAPLSAIQWTVFDIEMCHVPNGKVFTFSNNNPSQARATYSDPGGVQALPNPIALDVAGRINIPVYWKSGDGDKYYVVVTGPDGDLSNPISARANFPPSSGGASPVTNNLDFTNHLMNGQYRLFRETSVTLTAAEQYIADAKITHRRSNDSATSTISFVQFNNGQTAVPANPKYHLRYVCTIAGSGETYNDALHDMGDVRAFENRQMSFQLEGKSPGSAAIELFWIQDFGTGGSAAVPTSLGTINLITTWARYTITLPSIPSTGGKTVTSDNRAILAIRMPLDAIETVDITNVAVNIGATPFDYEYFTLLQEEARVQGESLPRVVEPEQTSGLQKLLPGSFIILNDDLEQEWFRRVGEYHMYAYEIPTPTGEYDADGSSYFYEDDPDLWDKIGNKYGYGAQGFRSRLLTTDVTVINQTGGVATDIADVSTGFTFTKKYDGADFGFTSQPNYSRSLIILNSEYSDPVTNYGQFIINNRLIGNITDTTVGTANVGVSKLEDGISSYPFQIDIVTGIMVHSTYFLIDTIQKNYYVWFKVDAVGTDPAVASRTGIEVDLLSTDTYPAIASKIVSALTDGGVFDFSSTFIYVRNKNTGIVTHATPETSPFAVYIVEVGETTYKKEVTAIPVTAASAITGGNHFNIDSTSTSYYVWYTVDTVGVDPAVATRTGIQVDILSTDTVLEVATKTTERLNGSEITDITCTAGSTLSAGDYFTLSGTTQNYYADYIIDNVESDPAVAGTKRIKVEIASSDTAIQVATKTNTAVTRAQFQVPDLRGLGVRAWNNGREELPGILRVDEDSLYRQLMGDFTTSGDNVGTTQLDTFKAHNHTYDHITPTALGPKVYIAGGTGDKYLTTFGGDASGAGSTRMTNMSVKITITR